MNAEGPINWYLSVKYDRDPITGAVSAHQHLYIDKLLKKWGMEQCNPLPAPFPQKTDEIVKELAEPVAIQRIPSTGWRFPLPASTYFSRHLGSIGTKQIHDSTRPDTSGESQESSALPQRAQDRHSTMVRSRLHRRTLARHNLWICQRILCRYNPSSTFISRIRLLAQQSCYLLARE